MGKLQSLNLVATKSSSDEDFPVAGLLIAKPKRAVVMDFYHLARQADDIADSDQLSAADKIAQIDALEAQLMAGQWPRLVPYQHHLIQLFQAFRQDANSQAITTWDDLIDYCQKSAQPVGRFLLDLHGEAENTQASCDALCTVLQLLNHLQDCRKDWLNLKRCYIPADMLARQSLVPSDLAISVSTAQHQAVFQQYLDATQPLLAKAQHLAALVRDKRLRLQSSMTIAIAISHFKMLRLSDPLAGAKLRKTQYIWAAIAGLWRGIRI